MLMEVQFEVCKYRDLGLQTAAWQGRKIPLVDQTLHDCVNINCRDSAASSQIALTTHWALISTEERNMLCIYVYVYIYIYMFCRIYIMIIFLYSLLPTSRINHAICLRMHHSIDLSVSGSLKRARTRTNSARPPKS